MDKNTVMGSAIAILGTFAYSLVADSHGHGHKAVDDKKKK
jgi:hypothetical protein